MLDFGGLQKQFIYSPGSGYHRIDPDAAAKRGIYVSNTPGVVDIVSLDVFEEVGSTNVTMK